MKKLLLTTCLLLISITAVAGMTYNSDGSYSQTVPNGSGGSSTYNSDGSYSQTLPNGTGGSTTYNSDGSYSSTN